MKSISLVPVKQLSDDCLLSESEKIPKLFYFVNSYGVQNGSNELKVTDMVYFQNKLRWLLSRYQNIFDELSRRGIGIKIKPNELYNKFSVLINRPEQDVWEPKKEQIEISWKIYVENLYDKMINKRLVCRWSI